MYLYFILGSFWVIFPAKQIKITKSAQGQLKNRSNQKVEENKAAVELNFLSNYNQVHQTNPTEPYCPVQMYLQNLVILHVISWSRFDSTFLVSSISLPH